jgi:hypothetical protein
MKRMSKFAVSALPIGFVLVFAASSFAQDAPAGGAAGDSRASSGQGDYGYKFEDDPLSAGGFGPADATIRVRPGPVRTTLIRPRTSFVPEMLKSVENI